MKKFFAERRKLALNPRQTPLLAALKGVKRFHDGARLIALQVPLNNGSAVLARRYPMGFRLSVKIRDCLCVKPKPDCFALLTWTHLRQVSWCSGSCDAIFPSRHRPRTMVTVLAAALMVTVTVTVTVTVRPRPRPATAASPRPSASPADEALAVRNPQSSVVRGAGVSPAAPGSTEPARCFLADSLPARRPEDEKGRSYACQGLADNPKDPPPVTAE